MNDKIAKTYLDIISENQDNDNIITEWYHNRPILGWNNNSFSKIMSKMIQHTISKIAYKEFDNYFLSDKLYSFKKLFKQKPEITIRWFWKIIFNNFKLYN